MTDIYDVLEEHLDNLMKYLRRAAHRSGEKEEVTSLTEISTIKHMAEAVLHDSEALGLERTWQTYKCKWQSAK